MSEGCFKEFLLPRLRSLEEDGLIKLFPYQVKVTQRGRGFIRNICAVLDERLQANQLSKPTFSKAV
jgi:oxygen-independent coproporphyrinogen-3 oxidase